MGQTSSNGPPEEPPPRPLATISAPPVAHFERIRTFCTVILPEHLALPAPKCLGFANFVWLSYNEFAALPTAHLVRHRAFFMLFPPATFAPPVTHLFLLRPLWMVILPKVFASLVASLVSLHPLSWLSWPRFSLFRRILFTLAANHLTTYQCAYSRWDICMWNICTFDSRSSQERP